MPSATASFGPRPASLAASAGTLAPATEDWSLHPGGPEDETQLRFEVDDLYDSIDYAEERMAPLRRLRREAIQEYGGRYWFEDDKRARPLNLTKRGVQVLTAHLAARNPRYEAVTERMQYRGTARKLSRALDVRAANAGMARFSRLCLLDAFFGGRAVVRVGERSGAESINDGTDRFVHAGEVYRRLVSADDWGIDPAARSDAEAFYEYDRHRIPRARAMAAVAQGIYGHDPEDPEAEPPALEGVATPEEAKDMIRRAPALADGRRSRNSIPPASDLTSGGVGDAQRYSLVDMIELIDVALYIDADTCILVTLLAERGAKPRFLRAEVWEGPGRGPYESLEFDPLPDSPFGPSVVSGMREQSEIANTVIGRMVDQIKRTRRVLVYQKQRASDALKITKTPDGGSVGIDGPVADMRDMDLGGLSADLAPFAQLIVGYWNAQGSYDILGSQPGTQGKTATESSQLFSNANILVQALAEMHDDFHTRLVRHEAWYLLNDPFIQTPLTMRLRGGAEIEVTYSAEQRTGTFEDYTFKIRPRSMQRVDPNIQTQRVIQIVQAVMQAAQAEQVTQGRVDSAAVARILGRRFEEEELDEILRDPVLAQQLVEDYAAVPGPEQGVPGRSYGAQAGGPQGMGGMGGAGGMRGMRGMGAMGGPQLPGIGGGGGAGWPPFSAAAPSPIFSPLGMRRAG